MKNKTWIALAAAFVLLMVLAGSLYNTLGNKFGADNLATVPQTAPAESTLPSEDTSPTETTAAPDYSAPDFTVEDREGNKIKLSDFEEAYLEYGDRINFVLVNLTDGSQETVESAAAYVDGQEYTFPIYFDTELSAAMAYGVNAVPVTYFIDAEGNLVAWGQGMLRPEDIAQGISMILPE